MNAEDEAKSSQPWQLIGLNDATNVPHLIFQNVSETTCLRLLIAVNYISIYFK